MLTKKQLKKIEQIIRKRFLSFTYEAVGPEALSEDELRVLREAGIIRGTTRSLIGDGITMGKVVALLEKEAGRRLSYGDVLKLAKKMAPTTEVERRASAYAKEHAGQYVKGLGDDLVKTTYATSAKSSLEALRAEVSDAIIERNTPSELKTRLFDAIDNKYRDWRRIASTELNNAIQQGIHQEIRDNSEHGENQLCYKRPAPDACKYCKKLFLSSDGVTPKIFRLRDLENSNVGRRASEWKPTVESVHPWCQCQLIMVPEGHSFEKRRIAVESFTALGKEFKRGQEIGDADYDGLTPVQRRKTGYDAFLTFTGEEVHPTVTKSELFDLGSEEDAECYCEY